MRETRLGAVEGQMEIKADDVQQADRSIPPQRGEAERHIVRILEHLSVRKAIRSDHGASGAPSGGSKSCVIDGHQAPLNLQAIQAAPPVGRNRA